MLKLMNYVVAAGFVAFQLPATALQSSDTALLQALAPYCGQAFAGQLISNPAEDADMVGQRLIVHVAGCRPGEVRMPFHVGEDRSRTWVLRELPQGLQLKHDHRHQDGTHDELMMFQALGRTAAPANVWSFTLQPGKQLVYRLSRPGREFAVAFDLTQPVALPPPAWGH